MSDILSFLKSRGLIHDVAEIDAHRQIDQPVYVGFDLTAPSLHVGSLVQLSMMQRLSHAGIKVIALMGEATTRVGDPTGKDTARPILSDAVIAENFLGIERVVKRLVPETVVRSNMEWFDGMQFLHFLREYGAHFSINRMLGMETVDRRIRSQTPMSFLEFSYMLLQATDFVHLHNEEGVHWQVGGSDQWGNIVMGIDLVRKITGASVGAFTTPLLVDRMGRKMGKTVDGAVWLDPDMTPPLDFFQFWRNVEDERVEQFLLTFTEFEHDHIREEIKDINAAKELLAMEITTLVHGEDEANKALRTAHQQFREGRATDAVVVEPQETLSALIHRLGWSESKNAARRLMQGGAVAVDGQRIDGDGIAPNRGTLTVGKKRAIALS